MAYRFNPPPNWPIEDAGWSPPPGWQPDPSWGPAPEGWNFWVAEEQPPAAPAQSDAQAAADAEEDATRVVSTGPREETAEPAEPAEPATSQVPAGQYGAMDPYGSGAQPTDAPAAQDSPGHRAATAEGNEDHDGAAADDATHVAGSGPHAAGTDPQEGQAGDGAPQTAEYQGPDLEADLAQQAPYESAAPAAGAAHDAPAAQDGQHGEDSGAAAAAGAGAAGGMAAGAAAAHGAGDPAQQPTGQAAAAPDYGQASPAAPGYGQASPAPGYGQASPAPGYGQASPSGYPGQGSAADYPAAGYGQASPGVDAGSHWTASTGAGEPPQKGFLRRFWWLGCLLILLLVLILLVAGGIWLFSRAGDTDAGGGGQTTTSQEQTTGEETTEAATSAEEETTEEEPIPTDQPTIDPSAEATEVVGSDGSGTLAVHMTYAPATELATTYGTVDEPSNGEEYLVLTAKMTVAEGTMSFNPAQFDVITPYGGAVSRSSESYSLEGAGTGGPLEFSEGEEYTFRIIFDVKRAEGLTLQFDAYVDQYRWDVPA
ncbi:hypothetical protein [Brachybacterium vulturis]|uniref:hypothetical protein n=1 Tax=Brachybacterium vulturis TaxID=2017484 RepID=UPI003735E5EA